MEYGKFIDGVLKYYWYGTWIEDEGMKVFNPSDDLLRKHDIYPVQIVYEEGIDEIIDGILVHYVAPEPEPVIDEKEVRKSEIETKLSDFGEVIEAVERFLAVNGVTQDDKNMAQSRLTLRDELGKLVQTETGDGSDMNPFHWNPGDMVTEGMWYLTHDDYLWEAIKTGYPESSIDREYFDVVGL